MDAKPKQKSSLDINKLVQPDLLSVEELSNILRERGVGSSLLSQSKEKLVTLFKRVALPLPQRKLRQNYRGSLLMKLRKKAERLKISESPTIDSKSYTHGVTGETTLTSQCHEEKCSSHRLKPPPDLVNYERKRIRLSSSNNSSETTKNSSSTDLDKIIIKKRKTSESSNDSLKDKNKIIKVSEKSEEKEDSKPKTDELINLDQNSSRTNEENDSSSREQCNGTTKKSDSAPRKVLLKRNRLIIPKTTSPEDIPDQTSSEPDKKRSPITWP